MILLYATYMQRFFLPTHFVFVPTTIQKLQFVKPVPKDPVYGFYDETQTGVDAVGSRFLYWLVNPSGQRIRNVGYSEESNLVVNINLT